MLPAAVSNACGSLEKNVTVEQNRLTETEHNSILTKEQTKQSRLAYIKMQWKRRETK